MTFIKNKIQKTSLAFRIMCCVLTVVLVSGIFMYVNKDGMDAKGESAIAPSSKEYIEVILKRMADGIQEDFTILEIVPYQGSGIYRYYAGSPEVETGLLSKSDTHLNALLTANGGGTSESKRDKWYSIDIGGDTYFDSMGYKIRYNYRADKYDIKVAPIFQANVLIKEKEMLDGKIKVNTVEANKLTETDIQKADLIVISNAPAYNGMPLWYNYFTGNVDETTGNPLTTTGVYKKSGTSYVEMAASEYKYITYDTYELVDGNYVSRDISWNMAKKLLEVLATGRNINTSDTTKKYITPVIMDGRMITGTAEEGKLDFASNMSKLATIIQMMDSSKYNDFVNNHMTVSAGGTNFVTKTGIPTAAYFYTTSTGTYATVNEMTSDVIVNSGVYAEADFIYKITNKYAVANNYLSRNSVAGGNPYNDPIATSNYEGLTDRGLADKTIADAIRYVLGCKDSYTTLTNSMLTSIYASMGKIRVLEIQPTNAFDYGSAANIAAALGVSADKVTIRSVSTKELNCLTEDIISAYDVIYIGMNDSVLTKSYHYDYADIYPDGDSTKKVPVYNDKNLNGYVYLAFGDLVKGSSAIMGMFSWEYIECKDNTTTITEISGTGINEPNAFDATKGNKFFGSSYDSWKGSNHTGMIMAKAIPDSPRYTMNIKWQDHTGYHSKNNSRPNQLKLNYIYEYNNNTKKLFSDHQQEILEAKGVGKVYGIVDIRDYYSAYKNKSTSDKVMDALYADKIGNCRLSDNDITEKTMRELKEFANSGKLIILDDEMYAKNSYKVYPTSHMYELIEYVTLAENDINCVNKTNMKNAFVTHVNKKAPMLQFSSKPADVTYTDGVVNMPEWTDRTDEAKNKQPHLLTYKFKVKAEAEAQYKVKLIIDKNCDGVYANSEKMVTDDTNEIYKTQFFGTDVNGEAELTISTTLPPTQNGLVAYKLEVVKMDASGKETKLRSALYGETLVRGKRNPEPIKVLQIIPYSQYEDATMNLNMSYKLNASGVYEASNTRFKNAMSKVDAEIVGYTLQIDTIYSYDFEAKFKAKPYTKGQDYDDNQDNNSYLAVNKYDMVIIGFGDSYLNDDISNFYGAMDCIRDYIEHENAVMFSHDTMSFCSTVNYGMVRASDGKGMKRAKYNFLNNDSSGNAMKICQSISQNLRNIVGLDRYGASLKTTNRDGKDKPTYANGIQMGYSTVSPDGNYYVEELHGYTDWNLYRESIIQYWAPNDQHDGLRFINPYTTTTGIATGSDNRTGGATWWTNSRSTWNVSKVEKVNNGQINVFPFQIPDELTIAGTHAQYYQLDLEADDVVVWYTLKGGSESYYGANKKDGRNQYYIYSKGSVTYTGAGHSKIGDSDSTTGELKLFINTIIKTITAKNSTPEIKVTNGALAGGMYNIYSDKVNDYQLKFKVEDADLTTLDTTDGSYEGLGRYKSGKVVLDLDKDGVIDDTDVVLEVYGSEEGDKILYNGVVNTINVLENRNLTDAQKAEVIRQMSEEGNIQFIIQAVDSKNKEATARAKISLKPLFNLD